MNGRIKVFSKAIMLNRTFAFGAVLIISLVITLLSNDLFLAAGYLFRYVSRKETFAFLQGNMKNLSLAVIYGVCVLISFAIMAPLKFSREIWFYETSKNNKMKLRRMFFSYRPHWFFRSIGLSFTLFFSKLLWALLFFLPCAAMTGYLVYTLQSGISKTMLLLVGASIAVSFLSGLYFSFVTFQRYSLSFVLLYENEGISALEAMKTSARLMDENCFGLSKLKLSFLAWILSCVFIIPAFYVYPYYKISVSYFLNNILCNN